MKAIADTGNRKRISKDIKILKIRKITRYLVIFSLIVIPAVCLGLVSKNFATSRLLKIQPLTYETYLDAAELEGITVKEEQLITAQSNGKLQFLVQDGTRIRVGSPIAEITTHDGTKKKVFSKISGILCYHIDGLENVLNQKNLNVLDLNKLETIPKGKDLQADYIENGQEIAKVVNNLEPIIIIAQVTKEQAEKAKIEKGNMLELFWSDDLQSKAIVQDLKKKENNLIAFLKISNFPDNIVDARKINFKIVNQKLNGYILPREALVEKEGKNGIYVIYKESVRWIPVTIENSIKNMVQISGDDLTPSIQVILNPGLIKEGSKFF